MITFHYTFFYHSRLFRYASKWLILSNNIFILTTYRSLLYRLCNTSVILCNTSVIFLSCVIKSLSGSITYRYRAQARNEINKCKPKVFKLMDLYIFLGSACYKLSETSECFVNPGTYRLKKYNPFLTSLPLHWEYYQHLPLVITLFCCVLSCRP